MLQEGTLFANRYRLLKEQGRGSFGEVWLAQDEQLDNMQVAIKAYVALDDRGIEEFKKEYKTAYGLNHPNLLHAYHFDVCDKRPYLVMPYCPDSALSLIGHCDTETLWQLIKDVSSGLAYLHSLDIVHHDIKPDNILRKEDGTFVITDFGISTKMRSTLRRNSTRAMSQNDTAGSLPYMGPEMFSDTPPPSIKATDIWAFGATLYEIITGDLPFWGQGGVMQMNGAQIPKFECDDIEMTQMVKACMSRNPWDRPTTDDLIQTAIKRKSPIPMIATHNNDSRKSEIEDPGSVIKRKERNRYILFTIIIICALLGGSMLSYYWRRYHYIQEVFVEELGEINYEKYFDKKNPPLSMSYSPSGLSYIVFSEGNNLRAGIEDSVYVSYAVSLKDGTVVDESAAPIKFIPKFLIPGMQEAFNYIGCGGEIVLIVPPELAYGEKDIGSIPANSTIIIYMILHSIERAKQ